MLPSCVRSPRGAEAKVMGQLGQKVTPEMVVARMKQYYCYLVARTEAPRRGVVRVSSLATDPRRENPSKPGSPVENFKSSPCPGEVHPSDKSYQTLASLERPTSPFRSIDVVRADERPDRIDPIWLSDEHRIWPFAELQVGSSRSEKQGNAFHCPETDPNPWRASLQSANIWGP